MHNAKRLVPRWIRTTSKIGLVLFTVLGLSTALTRNWLVAGGMLVFTLMQISMLLTTKSKS